MDEQPETVQHVEYVERRYLNGRFVRLSVCRGCKAAWPCLPMVRAWTERARQMAASLSWPSQPPGGLR